MTGRLTLLAAFLLLMGSPYVHAGSCDGLFNKGGVPVASRRPRILFMCVANSARSQLAEALARNIFGGKAIVQSAGSEPKSVNPFAIQVLEEIGIRTDHMASKGVVDLAPEFVQEIDFLITLCADEVCPVLPSRRAKKFHWPYPDPASVQGMNTEKLQSFRETRDLIRARILELASDLNLANGN